MSIHVSGTNLADAWLASYEKLSQSTGCSAVNFTVSIENPGLEVIAVRKAIDAEVARLGRTGKGEFNKSIHTVANTIFPISLYRSGHPDRFYKSALAGQSGRHGTITSWGSKGGTYIGRLLKYPTYGGENFNQLARMLEYLDADKDYQDSYEISTTCEYPDSNEGSPSLFASASTHVPAYDNVHRGGQCLSHISLHLSPDRKLSMTALYRHQTYLTRAYGNFLGLSRLLHFFVAESRKDIQLGELMIVASHADIERNARASRTTLVDTCRSAYDSADPTGIEWQARPFGAPWSDLKLPARA